MLSRLLPLFLVLAGCPDPTASPEGGGGSAGGPGPGAPPPGEGGPGGGPPPGGEGGAGGTRPTPPGFQVTAGEGVKLSGTVSYAGTASGPITIDFLRKTAGSTFPELVHSVTVEKPGPWEVEAPKSVGDLAVVAFIDANGNGPNPGEPAGRVKDLVSVGAEPITGLDIALSDTPDLGDLAPGGDSPPGGAPPPGGAAPPGGAEGAPPVQGAPGEGTAPAGAAPTDAAPKAE